MGKGDIRIPRPNGIFPPTASIASLRAIDTTSASNYPDGWIIVVKTSPEHSLYIFHRAETGVDDGDLIIDPTTGVGIWRKLETGSSITIDAVPTDGSANAVSSNGVFDALAGKLDLVTGGTIDDGSGFTTEIVAGAIEIEHIDGAITNINGQSIQTSFASFPTYVLTDGATVTPDFIIGQNNKITLGGNRALATPVYYDDDVDVTLEVLQDATGGRTLTFSSDYVFPVGFDKGLNSTANDRTLFTFKTDLLLNKLIYKSGGKTQSSGTASPLTTKGDLYTYSTINDRLPVGGNGSILTANSAASTGLQWLALGTANQLLRVNAGATALEYFTPTYISGNQTITLSGDVTGSGTTAITTTIATNAVTTTKIADSNVTQVKLTGFDYGTLTYSSNVAYNLTGKKVSDSQVLTAISADFILTFTATSAESGCVFNIHAVKSTASLVTVTLAGTGITFKGDRGATISNIILPAGSIGDVYEIIGKVRFTGSAIEIDMVINPGNVVQVTGTSIYDVMSQNAITLNFHKQGGSTFGATNTIGSTDAFDLSIVRDGSERLGILAAGGRFTGAGTGTGQTLLIRNSALTQVLVAQDNGLVMVGVGTPTARLHIVEASTNDISREETETAGTNPVLRKRAQAIVATTDATLTTLTSLTTTTDSGLVLRGIVEARRTGGAAGTTGDVAAYKIEAIYKNVAGTVTLVGGGVNAIGESQGAWDCQVNISGANLLIQVLGAASNSIRWQISEFKTSEVTS